MNIKNVIKNICTLGPIGYLPMPGTMGTLATLPLLFVLKTSFAYNITLVTVLLLALICTHIALPLFNGKKDPRAIVIDEVAGTLVTFYGVTFTSSTVLLGFLLFRFFDAVKPLGIKRVENNGGTWGVVLDDCAAGLISNVLLRFIIFYVL